MKTMMLASALFVSACVSAAGAGEEPLNCLVQQDPSQNTHCAGAALETAEKDLAAVLAMLTAQAVADDTTEGKGLHDTENALLNSQRAWLSFRDAECRWQGFTAHGDSMEPMLVNMCAVKLTRDRIKQLQTGVSE